jgi:lysosomal acid lipase/cholesteryl ester hydrolase
LDFQVELIKKSGHNYEVHQIETSDGYLLKVHRVLRNSSETQSKFTVFLMHGIFCTASDYIILGKDFSLASLLSNGNYDTWMGNARGNPYSDRHKSLDNNSKEYWDFSFHEIGLYDMSAMIDYALNYSNRSSLMYVGHSQGGSVILTLLSYRPEYNEKLLQVHLLGPAGYLDQPVKIPEADLVFELLVIFRIFEIHSDRISHSPRSCYTEYNAERWKT